MREVRIPTGSRAVDGASFLACLATILELRFEELPDLGADEDPASGSTVTRWLGGRGLGLARIADPGSFSWAGPWIARGRPPGADTRRAVVMYGVPSGAVWDPAGGAALEEGWIEEGFILAATDIALALPALPEAPVGAGALESIHVAASAGEPVESLSEVRALPGLGLEGDRHVAGRGTFPSGLPGSAVTIIAAEVCESFDPPLSPDEHRRNLVTRGIDPNALVGHEFTIGDVRLRGTRLCEPCTVIARYASRPILRELVHRGGLRADILEDGRIAVGDQVRALGSQS